jgi:lysyl-tRNA synthetase class 2
MNLSAILQRSALNSSIRSFFNAKGYLEVSTPILATHLIPEPTIAHFATRYIGEFTGQREVYLVPSPEVHMKQIIAETHKSIYQISPCFRNNEQIGSHHNPEFTMLEYYSVNANEIDSIALTEELLSFIAPKHTAEHLLPPFKVQTMAQACWQHAGFDLDKTQSLAALRQKAGELDLYVPDEPESWEETFNRIFVHCVEPNLAQDKPLVLTEYPEQIACLAKKIPNKPYRRRWELYMGQVEIANCYDEETEKEQVEQFYRQQYARLISQRAFSDEVIPDIDSSFVQLFDGRFPHCSGVALGIDRLLMLFGGYKRIGDLILFNLSDTMSGGH